MLLSYSPYSSSTFHILYFQGNASSIFNRLHLELNASRNAMTSTPERHHNLLLTAASFQISFTFPPTRKNTTADSERDSRDRQDAVVLGAPVSPAAITSHPLKKVELGEFRLGLAERSQAGSAFWRCESHWLRCSE